MKEVAIVLAEIVLAFYFTSVRPHGYPGPTPQAAIDNLFQQMDHEAKPLDETSMEMYRAAN